MYKHSEAIQSKNNTNTQNEGLRYPRHAAVVPQGVPVSQLEKRCSKVGC